MIYVLQEIYHYEGSSVLYVSSDLKRVYDYAVKYLTDPINWFDDLEITEYKLDVPIKEDYRIDHNGENCKTYFYYEHRRKHFRIYYDFDRKLIVNVNETKSNGEEAIKSAVGLVVGLSMLEDMFK